MPTNAPDLSHLISLLEAAKAEADRIGAPAAAVGQQLANAVAAARSSPPQSGADEGLRPEELTTGNDK